MDVYAFFTAFAGILFLFMALRFISVKKEYGVKFIFITTNLLFFILSFSLFFAIYATAPETQRLLFRLAVSVWLIIPLMLVSLAIPIAQRYRKKMIRVVRFVLLPLLFILIVTFQRAPLSVFDFYESSGGMLVYSFNQPGYWHYIAGLYCLLCGAITMWLLLRLKQTLYPYVSPKQKWQALLIIVPVPYFYLTVIILDIALPGLQNGLVLGATHLIGVPSSAALFYSATMYGSTANTWEELSGLFIQRIRQVIFFLDNQGHITYVNKFGLELLGHPLHEVSGKPVENFFSQPLIIKKQINLAGHVLESQRETVQLLPANASPVPCIVNIIKVPGKVYDKPGYVLVGIDIQEKVNLQSRVKERILIASKLHGLKTSLEKSVARRQNELSKAKEILEKEVANRMHVEKKLMREASLKETMLREIHHRVKNNIQMIISLINMGASETDTCEEMHKVYSHLTKRVRDISYVHDYFYDLPSMHRVNFNHFITKTTNELKCRKSKGKQILFKILGSDKTLTVKQAIPCGIILYELLTNAMQHAFPDPEVKNNQDINKSLVTVVFDFSDNDFYLKVKDNGVGMSVKQGAPANKGLGLSLVSNLVNDDLQGDITYSKTNGTNITVRFQGDFVNTV